jgi:cytochrome c
MRLTCLAAALLAAAPATAADCNLQAFASCQSCHALATGAGQKPGPQLAGVIGRAVAGDADFDYSPELRAARAKGDAWTKEKLDIFLSDPQAMYPGTWMGSPPIRDAKQRADLLCVLGSKE